MKKHSIKCHKEYFYQTALGKKSFEIRENDRNYQVGDIVQLEEFDPQTLKYTGCSLYGEITYITDFAQKPGWVVFSVKYDAP